MSLLFDYWEYFIPLLAVFGILTSVEDIREGIIKNKYIIIGCIGGIAIHLFLYSQHILSFTGIIIYACTIVLSIVLSMGLYLKEFWSAGDGKLLIAYTCLFPQTIFENTIAQVTIPLTILVNMCIPFFLYGAWKSFSNNLSSYKKVTLSTKKREIVSDLLFVFAIPWILTELLSTAGIEIPKIVILLCTMCIALVIEKYTLPISKLIYTVIIGILNLKLVKTDVIIKDEDLQWLAGIIILVPFCIIRVYLEYQTLFTVSVILDMIMYYIIIKLLKRYTRETIIQYYTQKVTIRGLKRGMIIQDIIIKTTLIEQKKSQINETAQIAKKSSIHHIASLLLKKNSNHKHAISTIKSTTNANNHHANKNNNINDGNSNNPNNNKYENKYLSNQHISKSIYSIQSKKSSAPDVYERTFIEALSDKDIKKIIEAHNEGRVQFNKLNIKKSIPFAPLALLGIIITIIIKGVFGLDFI